MHKILAIIIVLTLISTSHAGIENFDNIIFIHRSVGANLIRYGGVRELFERYNKEHGSDLTFWDYGYSSLTDGKRPYTPYGIVNHNTNPDGYFDLFAQPINDPPDNAFSRIMANHEVIVFKSCFTAARIWNEKVLFDYKRWYLAIRDIIDKHPDKLFIAVTPPPLAKAHTPPEMAERVRQFSKWLKSDEFVRGHPNLYVMDLWQLLAEQSSKSPYYNCLKGEYGGDTNDSHPNQAANTVIAPIFVKFITDAIENYSRSAPRSSSPYQIDKDGELVKAGK
jgi:hypothetical protein